MTTKIMKLRKRRMNFLKKDSIGNYI